MSFTETVKERLSVIGEPWFAQAFVDFAKNIHELEKPDLSLYPRIDSLLGNIIDRILQVGPDVPWDKVFDLIPRPPQPPVPYEPPKMTVKDLDSSIDMYTKLIEDLTKEKEELMSKENEEGSE